MRKALSCCFILGARGSDRRGATRTAISQCRAKCSTGSAANIGPATPPSPRQADKLVFEGTRPSLQNAHGKNGVNGITAGTAREAEQSAPLPKIRPSRHARTLGNAPAPRSERIRRWIRRTTSLPQGRAYDLRLLGLHSQSSTKSTIHRRLMMLISTMC